MAQDTPMSGMGSSNVTDRGNERLGANKPNADNAICPTCGRSDAQNQGLEQFLGRLGISDEMVRNLRSSVQNIHVEEYLNTAREYLTGSSDKATTYVKEHPKQVAAGVAALAVGTGLLIAALNRD